MPLQTTVEWNYQRYLKGVPTYFLTQHKYTGYSTSDIDFGIGVALDGNSPDTRQRLKTPSALADTFMGISMFVHKQSFGKPDEMTVINSSRVLKYDAKEEITYLRKCTIPVYSETAVDPSLPVHWCVITAGALVAGNFRAVADAARAVVLPKARWVETTTAAGLALLELDY
jgi:hypothetical protein